MGFQKSVNQMDLQEFRPGIRSTADFSDQLVMACMDWTLDKNSLYPPENPSEFGFCHNHAYTSGTMCFL
jgi:hypothetical protein